MNRTTSSGLLPREIWTNLLRRGSMGSYGTKKRIMARPDESSPDTNSSQSGNRLRRGARMDRDGGRTIACAEDCQYYRNIVAGWYTAWNGDVHLILSRESGREAGVENLGWYASNGHHRSGRRFIEDTPVGRWNLTVWQRYA